MCGVWSVECGVWRVGLRVRGRGREAHCSRYLAQRDVATVSEWRNDKALLGTEELILVGRQPVRHVDVHGAVVGTVVGALGIPVESRLEAGGSWHGSGSDVSD